MHTFVQDEFKYQQASEIAAQASWPGTLAEAHRWLDRLLEPDQRRQIKQTAPRELYRFSRTLGSWIRNQMGLWSNGPIMKPFADAGLFQPEDVSLIITRTYWRSLNGQSYSIEHEIALWRAEIAALDLEIHTAQPKKRRTSYQPTGGFF
jgi:hypothetical protein